MWPSITLATSVFDPSPDTRTSRSFTLTEFTTSRSISVAAKDGYPIDSSSSEASGSQLRSTRPRHVPLSGFWKFSTPSPSRANYLPTNSIAPWNILQIIQTSTCLRCVLSPILISTLVDMLNVVDSLQVIHAYSTRIPSPKIDEASWPRQHIRRSRQYQDRRSLRRMPSLSDSWSQFA